MATDYAKFFDPATPGDTKVGLLQNGAMLQPVIAGFNGNPLAAKATVTVLTVTFTSATTADVTFNLCESGTPALPGAAGKAVLETGTWKVADATLCTLVAMNNGGTAAPGCG
ncbi:hypothetical protein [Streptacidiphilus sp. EB129]|uniref:hypothetical protein n=1 Tax=Streptacidiphilus sp. EB129 TaxID=3156262 RepID=UPI0035125E4A